MTYHKQYSEAACGGAIVLTESMLDGMPAVYVWTVKPCLTHSPGVP
jgi:hypothetical protein